jgi:glycine dehydrogenase subunit 2
VRAGLERFLPNPQVQKDGDRFYVEKGADAIGSVSGFFGNARVWLKAYAYCLTLGREHLKDVGRFATINANYVRTALKDDYVLPIHGFAMHECVFDGLVDQSTGVTTLDVAKRLLDFGFHAPTIYFPLLFHQSIMIEPTETESLQTLDGFIDVMKRVAAEAKASPETLKAAPRTTPVTRIDEVFAARKMILTYQDYIKENGR